MCFETEAKGNSEMGCYICIFFTPYFFVYNQQDVDDTACEVQPFQLDEDFDYDRVPFTPKFDFLQRNI